MKNILVIGATGQIGSELTLELRKRYGDDHVVAGYIPSAMPKGELKASGPSAIADYLQPGCLALGSCRKPSGHGLENRYRRVVECTGSGT